MYPRARFLIVALAAALLPAANGCSGTVQGLDGDPSQDASADGGDAAADAIPDRKADARDAAPDTPADAFDEYVDPGCPDAPEPVIAYACDPLAQPSECEEGETCYPYVDYPSEPCDAEFYGAMCYPAGTGTQGDACESPFACGSGFVCVVSGSGNQCVRLCSLTDPSTCPDGQVCEPLDVAGLGGCL